MCFINKGEHNIFLFLFPLSLRLFVIPAAGSAFDEIHIKNLKKMKIKLANTRRISNFRLIQFQ